MVASHYDARNRPRFPLLGSLFRTLFLPGTLRLMLTTNVSLRGRLLPGQPACGCPLLPRVTDRYYQDIQAARLDGAGLR